MLYVDLAGFLNPSIVTGDKYRPDLLLTTKDNCLYIIELTVGYETNLGNNSKRKQDKYMDVIKEQRNILNPLNSSIFLLVEFLTKNLLHF